MRTFSQRLQHCCEVGRLTIVDLSIWFNRPYHTVSGWVRGHAEPWHVWHEEVLHCLNELEDLIRQRRHLPMSSALSPAARKVFIRKLRDVHLRVPKTHPAE